MRRKTTHLTTLLLWLIIAASAVLLSAVLEERPPIMMMAAAAESTEDNADAAKNNDDTDHQSDATTTSEGCNSDDKTCANPDTTTPQDAEPQLLLSPSGERLISPTELAFHGIKSTESKEAATAGGHTIWLSIMGRVYDVTSGGPSYYGPKGSYNFYSGRDASPCFHSGQNNEEGAAAKIEEWTDDKHLMSVYDWSLFYEKHDTYQFMGVLINSNYYKENGEETEVRKDIVERASKAKVIVEKEREERKKARLEKRKADREKNKGK